MHTPHRFFTSFKTQFFVSSLFLIVIVSGCKKNDPSPGGSGPKGLDPIVDQSKYGWETIGIIPRQSSVGAGYNMGMYGQDLQINGDKTQVFYKETRQDQTNNILLDFYKAELGSSVSDTATRTHLNYGECPPTTSSQYNNYRYGFLEGQFKTYQGYETNQINGGFSSGTMGIRSEGVPNLIPVLNSNDGNYAVPKYSADGFAYLYSERGVSGTYGYVTDASLKFYDGTKWTAHYQTWNFDYTGKISSGFSGFRLGGHLYAVRRFLDLGQHTQIQIMDTTIQQVGSPNIFKVVARLKLPEVSEIGTQYEGFSAVKSFGNKAVILMSKAGGISAYTWQAGDSLVHELYTLTGIKDLQSGEFTKPQKLGDFVITEDGTAYVLKDSQGSQVLKYSAAGVQPFSTEIPFVNSGMDCLRLINGYLYATVGVHQNIDDQHIDIVRLKL